MADQTSALEAGQRILERYQLKTVLGRGGFGVVWQAHDEELRMDVALKFLSDLIASHPDAVEDLRRETRFSLRLTHPHIVRIFNFFHDRSLAGISMEYMPGGTLVHLRVSRGERTFRIGELSPWLAQLCEALDYAHSRAKIIHRDLKPANLMLDSHGDLKVADFGISRSLSDTRTRLTNDKGTSGTLAYMSPQQLMGETASPSDDVYSLGATVYDLLSGKPPFFTGDIVQQVLRGKPPSIARRRLDLEVEGEEVPAEWEAVIASCMNKEAEDRPASAGEVAERLGLRVSRAPSAARVAPVTAAAPAETLETRRIELVPDSKSLDATVVMLDPNRTGAPPAPSLPSERITAESPPKRSSRAPLWIGLGLLGLGIAGAGVYFGMKPAAGPATPPGTAAVENAKPPVTPASNVPAGPPSSDPAAPAPSVPAGPAATTSTGPGAGATDGTAPGVTTTQAANPGKVAALVQNEDAKRTLESPPVVAQKSEPVKPAPVSPHRTETSVPATTGTAGTDTRRPAETVPPKTETIVPPAPPTNDGRKDAGMDLNALWGKKSPAGTSTGTGAAAPGSGATTPGGSSTTPTQTTPPPAAPDPERILKSGYSMLQTGRYDEARTLYRKLQADFPGTDHAARAQGQIIESYFLEKNYPEVIAQSKILVDRYGTAEWARNYAHFKSQRAYHAQGDHANAYREGSAVEAGSGWRDEVLSLMGDSAYRLARYDDAVAAYTELAGRPPTRWADHVQRELGWSYRKLAKHDRAIVAFEAYLEKNPNGKLSADAMWGLATSQIDAGRTADGKKTLTDLMSRFPNSVQATDARDKLARLP